MKDKPFKGHVCALITIMIWGTTFISTKVLLKYLTPIEILFIRFLIGYCVLWCVCPHRLIVEKKQKEWYFAAAGLCGITLYYLFENIALTYTSASNTGVIISVAPFFTVIFACIFLHERRPSVRFLIGFLIAMTGIVLITFRSRTDLSINPLGDLLAGAAAVIWAAYSILTKKISEFGYHTILATRRTFFYGLVFMVPVLLVSGVDVRMHELMNPKTALNLLFLGLGASAFCFVSWNMAVKILGSVKTSVYIYMVPVITAVTSVIILHEKMTAGIICGIILTLTGLFISDNRKEKKEIKTDGTKSRKMCNGH